MSQNFDPIPRGDKVGIWGNKECMLCGACCYRHLNQIGAKGHCYEIIDRKAYCTMHEEPRGFLCELYFCWMEDDPGKREELRRIAIDILKTAPPGYKE